MMMSLLLLRYCQSNDNNAIGSRGLDAKTMREELEWAFFFLLNMNFCFSKIRMGIKSISYFRVCFCFFLLIFDL